ncbi:hypothetical protein HGM15179_004687 [Zosterops borbonicus]|uniref:NADP-retinol dehydrogenase n=1 Tax=Zosterops borbonicus TaxID=364589 RepID=A0A8K1LQC3_9PASS|nr:hypothetical protein HGM15179_004687 [Zosterops borbonicus]
MNILLEFFVVTFRVLWAFVLAAAKWLVRPKEKSVAGQVCLITGAGSGLGRLFALEFARRRALLVLWDINTQSNEETAGMVRHIYREMAEEAAAAGPGVAGDGEKDVLPHSNLQVYTYTCDVGKRENVYLTAERVRKEVGEVSVLVNNAGVVSGHHLLECPDELIERTMMVNCHAHFWTTKAFLPKMLEMNHGHIVTVASSLGLFSTAGVEDYCASKFGAVGFHESLSHELKAAEKDGIKTTLVCPYLVDTGMFRGCRIRKEIEPFLPPLKPEYCVKQAMRAILTDQPMICTPRLMYMVTFMKSFMGDSYEAGRDLSQDGVGTGVSLVYVAPKCCEYHVMPNPYESCLQEQLGKIERDKSYVVNAHKGTLHSTMEELATTNGIVDHAIINSSKSSTYRALSGEGQRVPGATSGSVEHQPHL